MVDGGREEVDPVHVTAAASVEPALKAKLYERARASRWQVPADAFAAALDSSVRHAFAGKSPAPSEIERYLSSLHLDDLALACACAVGHDAAWDHFIREHRPALYRAADAIDRTGGARELADSLYADLYGLRERDGERQSLFRYFHGRSSLGSWVRAVLSQRYIDRVRATKRLEPLPDENAPTAVVAPGPEANPERTRFQDAMRIALAAALAALAPRDRLRLASYYAQNMKLAAIGRVLGEHEATVSRQLARTRRDIRAAVERHLRDALGYDEGAITECFATAVDDSGSLDVTAMLETTASGKKLAPDRS